MDDLIKFIKEKYIEDLISPVDLHTLIIFIAFVGILGLAINTSYLGSIWLEIGSINVKNIFDPKSEIWSNITLFQIMLSVVLTLIISPIYSRLKSEFFQAFSKIRNLESYIRKLTNKIKEKLTGNQALDLLLVKDLSKDINIRKKKLIKFHTLGEACIACLIISIIGLSKKFNIFDLFSFSMFLILVIFIQWKAYLYYLENVLPVILPEKILMDSKFKADVDY
jgi:hypothetical protein